ncbi:hypothetical protein L484_010803 [Morus notabilis]|uniref:Uncharacterized protein n=1 Tax=Morus notabilis TaxID=981085 RepID=W9SAN8_9ROSA|nr:hypothetical protein L484_010803 [Morus notabilis]
MAGESTHPDSKASSHMPSSSSAVSHCKSRWQQPTSAAAAELSPNLARFRVDIGNK